jgi:hypothetical protein
MTFSFLLSPSRGTNFIYALTFISLSENKAVPVGTTTELVEGDASPLPDAAFGG